MIKRVISNSLFIALTLTCQSFGQTYPLSPYVTRLPVCDYPGDMAMTALLFEPGLFDKIGSDLVEQWMDDISSEGRRPIALEASFPDAQTMREWLEEWSNWSPLLWDAVLIGDHPYIMCIGPTVGPSGGEPDTFPSDMYFWDVDGNWQDLNNDGYIDSWPGLTRDYDAEVIVARIAPLDVSTLSYEYDEIALLQAYLRRNHDWRRNGGWGENSLLLYVDDDWTEDIGPDSYWEMYEWCSELYYYYDHYQTEHSHYVSKISDPIFLWAQVVAHTGEYALHLQAHQWTIPGEEDNTTTNDHVLDSAVIPFMLLYACHSCDFSFSHPIGASYLLGENNRGLAVCGSTKTGGMDITGVFYGRIADDDTIGDALRAFWNDRMYVFGLYHPVPEELVGRYFGLEILGDPTLVPNMHW